ncbi:MAG: PH domain-containing protein [Gammaproteobacteria bacterium]|nr:PH domain-containing protein [Gammaproteobacteria bacterium]
MKLDTGETLELDIMPNEKLLVIWFLTKTITYSVATMFFVFMILFFINTINLATEVELEKENKTETSQNISKNEPSEDKVKKKIDHPFSIMVDYWGWALALVGISSVIIQIYLIYLRKTYRYVITNRRCIFIGGILKRIERTVPYKKITDIQRSQNIIERMLGIWNVQIFTPGTASMQIGQAKAKAELNFDGLLNSEELYETINRHTQVN